MTASLLALVLLSQQQGVPITAPGQVRTIAVVPWQYRGGTDGAIRTANDTVDAFFDKAKCDRVSKVKVIAALGDLGDTDIKEFGEENDASAPLLGANSLLALGEKLNVDLVCTGRARWHTKSVWVALGPKTKADCTVDVVIIDVKKKTIVLSQQDIKADDTRKETGLETAAAIFVTIGVTAFSGGPKTPHQQKAAQTALGLAFEPWLKYAIPSAAR